MNTKANHSKLSSFRDAKALSITNFKNLCNLNNSLLELNKTLIEYKIKVNFPKEFETEILSVKDKCSRITSVLERKQMKCAFFGRTSNGKSSVINSILGQKILPFGIGHTTNCFVQIQGTPEGEGFIIKSKKSGPDYKMDDGAGSETLHINSVVDLSHALSNDKVSSETLISLYWPHQNCDLLKADVTLLDSPGIDIDPDLDFWINHHCLDADVFVLVANAESTLTQTEKSFFMKVKEKLSKPNIFILNNRWDVCDIEEDYLAEAKNQHEQKCIDFLTKELEVCTLKEALERVFFVSAKEMLDYRTNESLIKSGNVKFLDRYESFLNFERSLEKNLCASALKTKFSSHSLQGIQLIEKMISMINHIDDKISNHAIETTEKKLVLKQKHTQINNGLTKTNEIVSKQILIVMENIRFRIVESMRLEIKHLSSVVKNFSSPFDSDPGHMLVYKTDLNNFVEKEINKRISSVCSVAVKNEMVQFKKFLMDEFTKLVGHEIDKSVMDTIERTNIHEFTLPCNSLFSNFKENLTFQWPFSPQALMSNIFMISYEARNQMSMNYLESNHVPFSTRFGTLRPIASQIMDSFINKEFLGFCIISALICKVTGFRVVTSTIFAYGILYVFERFRWNRHTQEKKFKNQYVKYASNQLTNLIDICTRSFSNVIREDLHMNQRSVSRFIDNDLNRYDTDIRKYESELTYMSEHLRTIESLKSDAAAIEENLLRFKELYL